VFVLGNEPGHFTQDNRGINHYCNVLFFSQTKRTHQTDTNIISENTTNNTNHHTIQELVSVDIYMDPFDPRVLINNEFKYRSVCDF